jgi:hypothetical protein
MSNKTYKVIVNQRKDNYDYDGVYYEFINNDMMQFSVRNLSGCPEDAIIGRNLFDADDYIRAVKTGMMLAQDGYTDLDVEYKKL